MTIGYWGPGIITRQMYQFRIYFHNNKLWLFHLHKGSLTVFFLHIFMVQLLLQVILYHEVIIKVRFIILALSL